ncbi:hypothetical protein [Streptomyces caniscabiei]|uniref:hypothetical protein n=1 Tax=Streptomyces caniscabiei TaxID=2746961 RepID=UPI000A435B36|nr:hypothetical protein [Streptomyces caniscabiei]
MSAVAAPAATLDRPFGELFDGSVDQAPVLPGQRNALRSVPASGQAGNEGSDDPLRLGRKMRLRLLAAVQALLADPSIAGLKDAPKLAAVVLYAKSRAPKGEKNDNQTSIWGAELGRWLGMKESTVHHKVLPVLRGTDALHTQVVRNAKGHPTGLNCLVMPLWNARKNGGAAHPLALDKAELATLLRLIEALFGPGWTPEDKEPTPPGLLAGRTGKGAATDRLGLLLMVLNTRASGWLQLCGGSVKKKEGRGAATLARLLGCSPSGARKVLARLTEAGVVSRGRKATSTRMNGRGRVMLLPVARAYGRVLAPVEAVSGVGPVFSAHPDGACGDDAPASAAGALGTSGIGGAEGPGDAADQERPDGAELHADHASVVTPVLPPQLSCGFSGEDRGGEGRRPERACAGEDQVVEADADGRLTPVGGLGGPLRGEQPKDCPVVAVSGQAGAAAGSARPTVVGGSGARPQRGRRVEGPVDLHLRVVLSPVAGLWARMSRGQQAVVRRAAERALGALSGIVDPPVAPQLLADRLADRLQEAGGEALVREPVGWLLGRGLVQRQVCTDARCDDGIRLDTRSDCTRCGEVIAGRREVRARVRAELEEEVGGGPAADRRAAYEQRLRTLVLLEADRARARQARETAAVQTRRAAAVRRQEADELARRSAPCAGCGLLNAEGLCPPCTYGQRRDALVREAVDLAVAMRADAGDLAQVAALTKRCEADTRALVEAVCRRESGGDEAMAAFMAPEVAERIRDERRDSALRRLLACEEAEAEALSVYGTALRQRPHDLRAAEAAAEKARHRTARHVLGSLIGELRVVRARAAAGRGLRPAVGR